MFIIPVINYASEYKVPNKPASIAIADINLDGYPDIVIGHDVYSDTKWSGLSILLNDGKGNFTVSDTVYLAGGQPSIHVENIDLNPYPEIFAKYHNYENNNEYIAVIKNYNLDSVTLFPLNTTVGISSFEVAEINYDDNPDIIVASNPGKCWGILYNDGKGGFSTPIYFNLDFYPGGLAVGDLNGDDRKDIVISGVKVKLFLNNLNGLDTITITDVPSTLHDVNIVDIDNDGENEIVGIDGGMPGTRKKILIYSKDENNNFQLTHISQWINEAMGKIFIADLNNDTYKDIVFNSSLHYPNSDYELFHTFVLFNNKDGTFQDPINYFTGICSKMSSVADLNGDGWKDIVTLNYDFYNPPPDTCTINILFNDGSGKFITDTLKDKFWQYKSELDGIAVYSFALLGDDTVFAGTASGIYVSTDSGNSWGYKLGTHSVSAMAVDLAGNIYAGYENGLYRSTDDGNSWVGGSTGYDWVIALAINVNGDIIAGCQGGGIYISTDDGNNWHRRNNGLTNFYVPSLAVNNRGDIFAGTTKGVFRSTDYGNNWSEINNGLVDSTITSLTVNNQGEVFCGTEGGLYYSNDNGNNWNKTSLPNNVVTSIITLNGDMFVGTFTRGVYHSTDNGSNWQQVNGGFFYPSIVSLIVNSEGYLLAGAMGGEVYKSLNSITFVEGLNPSIPSDYNLYQNYPNPFNPSTTITYQLPKSGNVTLKIFDILGNEVKTLVNEQKEMGRYTVQFSAEGGASSLASGMYVYRLRVNDYISTKKMLLLK